MSKDNHGGKTTGPGAIAELFAKLKREEGVMLEQLDGKARALAQSALTKLDVVSRDEFDAQAALLERTSARVSELESLLEALTDQLSALQQTQS